MLELILLFVFIVTAVTIITVLVLRKWKHKVLPEVKKLVGVGPKGPRFRKRDKVLFYGRKMLRKVKSLSGQVKQGKKRKLVLKLANRILRLKKDAERAPEIKTLEPPAEYLQEDLKDDQNIPPDAFYMLQSIRVFGHFEKPIFLKLCKHTEILTLSAGEFLFKIGEPDENVYVVQNGKVNVFINNSDGSTISLKVVKPGDSVTSLLSFTDVLTGHPHPYRTVSARAIEDSTVVRLPMAAFQEVFQEYPDSFIRVMQVIMVRLQRVTFTALHQYLGLTAELVKPSKDKERKKPSHGSPTKIRESIILKDDCSSNFVSPTDEDADLAGQPTTRKSRSAFELKPPPEFNEEGARVPRGTASRKSLENMTEEELIKVATEAFVRELGLEDDTVFAGDRDKLEIKQVPAGTYLMKEESNKDVALVYLLSGTLSVSQRTPDVNDEVHMFTAYPGEIVGGLAVLTGEPSFYSIRAKHQATIALLSKSTVYNILREQPKVVLHIAHTVVRRLSPFVRQVDFALDWVFLESGRAVYRQGDDSDCTYIVLSGRLRSVITHSSGKKELVGEYGKGDLVGIVEMVTQTPRSTTVIAVRDSELAKLPEGLFNAIKMRFPVVVTRLINLLGHRIIGSWQNPSVGRVDNRPTHNNFTTVAILPVSEDVPLTAFTYELYHCLCAIGPTLRLTSEVVKKTLGVSIMDPSQEYRLTSWLAQQEDQHNISLYQCDHSFTAWTQRCLRQADCVLIVGLGYKEPSIGKIEQEIERLGIRTQKELVLLHKEGCEQPSNTLEWLNMRQWITCHHHLLCNPRMFSRRSLFRLNELYAKVLTTEPSIHSDFSRLARWLTGMSIGLVLGGGGAKGASHVGMIKAIEEAGIPIDMVGGVSIGAFIGGLWCKHRDITIVTQKAREWVKKINQWWSLIFDLTYPVTSMFTGRAFNSTLQSAFGDVRIEDLWVPYFTLSTDISASAMRIHRHGVMWRYIRASMSLSGYLPPVCDPVDGHLLLDGGYVNNLPADIMRNLGARHVLAIDVGSTDDVDLTNYGDSLSGWWVLWKRFNPFAAPVKVPNLPEIQSRLAYVSCVRQLEEVKTSDYCEYIRPPIDKYKTLQFSSFDEIKEVGYTYGKAYFTALMKEGPPIFLKRPNSATVHNAATAESSTGPPHITGYKFTDLAQMVCKVSPMDRTIDMTSSSSSGDESEADEEAQEVGYASEPSAYFLQRPSTDLLRRRAGSLSLSEPEIETESEVEEAPRK
uniref:Neuropathy target esterase sws n=1 Tax=Lygus hesperus TaxID=30085 RepID=A0A0A9XBN8_LYGHE